MTIGWWPNDNSVNRLSAHPTFDLNAVDCGRAVSCGEIKQQSSDYLWTWTTYEYVGKFIIQLGRNPGGTAIPGQPATEVEQAPSTPSDSKNQFNICCPPMEELSDVKLIRTDTTLWS